jgi:hypothetical protein
MGPDVIVPVSGMIMILGIVLGIPLVRSYTKRVEAGARQPALPADLVARLERIEQGIEAMSMEVERISEGQRFTTKLLSESRSAPALPAQGAAAAAPAPAAQSAQPQQQQGVPEGTVLVESARRNG